MPAAKVGTGELRVIANILSIPMPVMRMGDVRVLFLSCMYFKYR